MQDSNPSGSQTQHVDILLAIHIFLMDIMHFDHDIEEES